MMLGEAVVEIVYIERAKYGYVFRGDELYASFHPLYSGLDRQER